MSAPPDLREVSRVRDERFGTVVVTGASSGIGRACALHLAACGFDVFAGVRRDEDGALLRAAGGGRVEPIRIDVTDAESIAVAARTIAARTGAAGITGLVNNAGIGVAGMLELLPLDDLRRQLEVNVVGLVAVTQAFLPALRRARAQGDRARIVHVGSSNGYFAPPLLGAYNASKFAVEAISDTMRRELAPWGIEVSLVEPGAIDTPIFDKSSRDADDRLAKLPEDAQRLYGPLIEAIRRSVAKRTGGARPPRAVALAVEHALRATPPRTRYRVGADATVQWVLGRWLPDRWADAVLRRFLGLPKRIA